MNGIFNDYYSLLQIHYRAEPDIISTAYKRLSKRYHPDVNKSKYAEDMMKKVNIAYETLSDARKRAEYNREWLKKMGVSKYGGASSSVPKYRPNTRMEDACSELEAYYRMISEKDYESAYKCISKSDRKNIKADDFVKWQTAVGKAVELGEAKAHFFKMYTNKRLGKKIYDEVIECSVNLNEKDLANGRFKEYVSSKNMVFEDGSWKVFLGYQSVKPLIARFEGNGGINVDIKAASENWLLQKSKQDGLTQLPNIAGFLEMAAAETARSKRYDNVFSIAAFEVVHQGAGKKRAADVEGMTVFAADTLRDSLRDTDILCRWNDMKFLALLTESEIISANRAVNRICRVFNREMLKYNNKNDYYAVFAGVSQFDFVSIETTIRLCNVNLGLAKRTSRLRAVTGVYTRLRNVRFSKRVAVE